MIRKILDWSADILVRKFDAIFADRNVRAPCAIALAAVLCCGCACPRGGERRFDLQSDSFSFANELRWQYEFTDSGKPITRKSEPPPNFSLRCFPMVRAAREFFYHAEFRADVPRTAQEQYAEKVAAIMHRNSRCPAKPGDRIIIPGYRNLHEFSIEHEDLLKSECGGANRSFLQRGNWRMVFPVTKSGEKKSAEHLLAELSKNRLPVVHLYRFPDTTLNHAVLIYSSEESPSAITFVAYDPNDPGRPAMLTFDRETSAFLFERNRYFAGGTVKVYEVYRGLLF
jgi:hypothetical protein